MRDQRSIFGNVDWFLVILYLVLVMMGWGNIYAAVYNEDHNSIFDLTQNYGKQMIWIATSLVLALAILIIDAKFYEAFSYAIYGVCIAMLLAVIIFGREVAGTRAWFEIGNFKLQPAEFAKFATALALSKYLSSLNIKIKDLRTKIFTTLLLGLPMGLILLQPDTGSALVFTCFVFVLFREGLSGNFLIFGVLGALLFILALLVDKIILIGALAAGCIILYLIVRKDRQNLFAVIGIFILTSLTVYSVDYVFDNVLEQHQRKRINVLLGKEIDPKGAGYNVLQSKIAIGSGGFLGKGYLQGTQTKFDFVPEQSTDFIFCTVGEEWGFLGSAFIIILFTVLLIRIVFIAERQRSSFSRIYGYSVASILFFHLLVNIGMTIGLAPVIGIPLPFFSYGGSALWGFTILLFILIKMDSYRLMILR